MENFLQQEYSISDITEVYQGWTKIGDYRCQSRHADCFVFVLSGRATYFSEGKVCTVQAGSILFLPYRSCYEHTVHTADYHYLVVDFRFFTLSAQVQEVRAFQGEDIRCAESIFWKMLHAWQTNEFPQRIACKGMLYNIYALIAAAVTSHYLPGDHRVRLERAANYAREQYADAGLLVQHLAQQAGMSEVHFRRLFRQVYRTSPQRFLQEIRLRQARQLLLEESLPIAEIAARCGFENACYFSRFFRKAMGMTPQSYRKKTEQIR